MSKALGVKIRINNDFGSVRKFCQSHREWTERQVFRVVNNEATVEEVEDLSFFIMKICNPQQYMSNREFTIEPAKKTYNLEDLSGSYTFKPTGMTWAILSNGELDKITDTSTEAAKARLRMCQKVYLSEIKSLKVKEGSPQIPYRSQTFKESILGTERYNRTKEFLTNHPLVSCVDGNGKETNVNVAREPLFLLVDFSKVADNTVALVRKEFIAYDTLLKALDANDENEIYDLAYAAGIVMPTEKDSKSVFKLIFDNIKSDLNAFLHAAVSPDRIMRVILRRATEFVPEGKDVAVVNIDSAGTYWFGGQPVATNENELLVWSKNNPKSYEFIEAQVAPKTEATQEEVKKEIKELTKEEKVLMPDEEFAKKVKELANAKRAVNTKIALSKSPIIKTEEEMDMRLEQARQEAVDLNVSEHFDEWYSKYADEIQEKRNKIRASKRTESNV